MSRKTADQRLQRRGFTLVEVMMGLTIGLIVLLGARAVLSQIADNAARAMAASVAADRSANTERAIRTLIERMVAADTRHIFHGTASKVTFTSWCDVPEGWQELCQVTIQLVRQALPDTTGAVATIPSLSRRNAQLTRTRYAGLNTEVLIVRVVTSAGDTLAFWDRDTNARLAYLVTPIRGGAWQDFWSPGGMTTPLAIGLLGVRDTLLFRIGERR